MVRDLIRVHCHAVDKEMWLFCDIQHFKIITRIMMGTIFSYPLNHSDKDFLGKFFLKILFIC